MGVTTLRPINVYDASFIFPVAGGGGNHTTAIADNDDGSYIYEQNRSSGMSGFTVDWAAYTTLPAGAIITAVTPRVRLWANGIGPNQDGSGAYGGIFWTMKGPGGQGVDNFVSPNAVNTTYTGASQSTDFLGEAWTPAKVDLMDMRVTFRGFFIEARMVAAYLDVTYNEAPTATATGSGTVTTTRPTLTHTYSDPENVAQQLYRWKVYSAAQYGAAGFDPNTSTPTYDSGVLSGNAASHTVPVDLANTTTYRAFIFVSDLAGAGHWNIVTASGPYRQFTVSLDPPAAPHVETSVEPSGAVVLNIYGHDNVLSADESSFESSLGTWAAYSGCTVARSTAQAAHGAASMAITATAAGNMVVKMPVGTNAKPVTPGARYSAELSTRANSGSATRFVSISVYWFKADGTMSTVLASSEAGQYRNGAALWENIGGAVTAPSDAAYGSLQITVVGVTTAGELHFVDKLGLHPDKLAPGVTQFLPRPWTLGGLLSSQRFQIERSTDGGLTWHTFRALVATGSNTYAHATTLDASDASQLLIARDYEAPQGVQSLYRVKATATVSNQTVASTWGTNPEATATPPVPSGWRLKHPLLPHLSVDVNALGTELVQTSTEDQETFYPLGRENAVVVSGDVHGETFPLELHFPSEAAFQAWETLRRTQTPLLLQTPFEQMWVRFGPTREKVRRWGGMRLARTSVTEVDAPPVVVA